MSKCTIRSSAVGVLLAGVMVIAGCSSTSQSASQAPAELNNQPSLRMPDTRNGDMIVPPAPAVPELSAAGSAAQPSGGDAPAGPSAPAGGDLYPTPEPQDVGEQRGTGQPITKNGVTNAFVAKLTGADSVNHTDTKWGVSGAGNAVMWDGGNGQVLTMFGDTFGAPRPQGESADQAPLISGDGLNLPIMPKSIPFPALPYVNLKQGSTAGSGFAGDTGTAGPTGFDWRVNTLAYSSSKTLTDFGYSSFVTDRAAHAREMLGARRVNGNEITTLPTSGISVGGKQYLTYSSVRRYGPSPGSWTSNYSGIAVSTDSGVSWRKSKSAYWTNSGPARNFQMPALARRGNTVYMFGTEQGRVGGVYVSRVRADQILNKQVYEYWNGRSWVRGLRAEPRAVVSGGVGEVSVQWSQSLGRWIMLSTDVFKNGIVLRQAATPQGPWTAGQVVASGTDYPAIYGASIHPWSKGNDLYFTMSQWTSYNVYLMHATVRRETIPAPGVAIPEIPLPGGARLPAGPLPDLGLGTLQLPKSLLGPQGNPNAPRGPS